MSDVQIAVTVAVLAVSVWITRFLPFAVFRKTEKLPRTVVYLGKVLPAAMMGLLVVYCFKDYDFGSVTEVLPALISVAAIVAIHLYKRNTVLSIAAGTVVYMLLIRII